MELERNKEPLNKQAHRFVYKINNDLESKHYFSAAFIDLSQDFDKV